MRRYKIFAISLLLLVSACTAQVTRHNLAYFENTCADTLEVTVRNGSNFKIPHYNTAVVAPREKVIVATYMDYTESIEAQVQADYELIIRRGERSLTVGKNELLRLLKNAPQKTQGTNREWSLSDKSLCP